MKTFGEVLEHDICSSSFGKLRTALLMPGWTNTFIRFKEKRARSIAKKEEYDIQQAFFHENKTAKASWMPHQFIDFLLDKLKLGRFYIV